jgi:hypothetical protein
MTDEEKKKLADKGVILHKVDATHGKIKVEIK